MIVHALKKRMESYQAENLLRKRFPIQHRNQNKIRINDQTLINFCSNDYLGLATDIRIKKTFAEAAATLGMGSGASAQVSGYYTEHQALEEEFAEFLNRERVLLFNSGYQANIGTITAIANRNTTIVADKSCHVSLIDGIILSRARHYRYRHHDLDHAKQITESIARPNLFITESVNSMSGEITDLPTLVKLAKKNQACLLVDDAHGIGYLGQQGAGACDFFNLAPNDVSYLIVPFGKALGSMGAVVAGSVNHIESLLQFSRNYRYTTALPPALCCATLAALNLIKTEKWRREKLQYLIQFFIKESTRRGLPILGHESTPIKSIICGTNQAAISIQEWLLQKGLFVSCIRPPTVTKNTSRIRISINTLHDENEIIFLLDHLAEAYEQLPKFQ